MALPAKFQKPLSIYRGDTYEKTLVLTKAVTFDAAGNPLTTAPIDLTTYGNVWAAQLRASDLSDNSISFTLVTTDLNIGKIVLQLSSTDTDILPAKGIWDLQATDTNQNPHYVRTVVRGEFIRINDVTR